MARREAKHLKVLYFDLRVKDIKEYFSHEQYSGYHSKYKTTDLEIFDLIREMSHELSWLPYCLNHFEVTNIGANHDLMQLFEEAVPEPETL